MAKTVKLPDNISEEELVRLSKMKELYVKYTNEGLKDEEYELMRQVAEELSYCFAVDTKV
jgi:hypothetical protein